MRTIIVFALVIGTGWLIAWGLSELVGLILPAAAFPMFLILAGGWAWIGWRYMQMRGRLS
jgi:hypothetical protein